MNTHMLKTWPGPFMAVKAGIKRHEIRKADRDFELGDTVILNEWDPATGEYTGAMLAFTIGFVTAPETWGLPEGVCVFSLLNYEPAKDMTK